MAGKTLDVYYHGKQVGTLAEMSDKRIAFQYSDEWKQTGFAISPFSLPLKDNVFVPGFNSRDFFKGLFGVFADSLPDAWGELLLDRFLLSKEIGLDDVSVIDKLDQLFVLGGSSGGTRPKILISENDREWIVKFPAKNDPLYKTMCFNILTHNLDDHTKNFSFLFDEKNGWRLSPAYDITYSDTYFGEHTTSVNGKGRGFKFDEIVRGCAGNQ